MSAPGPANARPRSRYGKRDRPMTNTDLVSDLCEVSVPLREAQRVHLKTYGVLIPHVFMEDVLKHIGACLRVDPQTWIAAPETQGLLDVLEDGMTYGDRETRNVITISFTRDSEVEAFFQLLLPMLGPNTRAQLVGR